MDAQQPQDTSVAPQGKLDPDVVMECQVSQEVYIHAQPNLSSSENQNIGAEAGQDKKLSMTGDTKGAEERDNGTEENQVEAAQLPNSGPSSPSKKRPTSTRASEEIFKSLAVDDDDSSKKSTASAGDTSSIDSNEDRRLSDTMKKAWREVRGQQGRGDPLEQWMVKHSGGTFTEKPRRQVFGEPSDKQ
ncbi:hypothetical protein F5B22DRAFT_343950 [Xylaria bambusicola]|uniref:uncharacterized protein n=1 Tax=Xylaria bambusicola TaxID=326684 RepID=UPI0020080E44|nr:uncharacterized protein F5B22DRAFT_343950 [Xylaria bambusicola]KAI0525488.1 hypothetical protein F5B22DRAFT_343950 [Xylaria bambusicola]